MLRTLDARPTSLVNLRGWLPLREMRQQHKSMFTFNKNLNDHKYPIFQKKNLQSLELSKTRAHHYKSSFEFSEVKVWNALLSSLKEETSMEFLKNKIKLHTNWTSILQTLMRLFLLLACYLHLFCSCV